MYRFDASGQFAFRGYLWQERPEGMAMFEVSSIGTAVVEGDALILDTEHGTSVLIEPVEAPATGSTTSEDEVEPATERHRWTVVDGGRGLNLTDEQGVTVDYVRMDES